MDGLHIIANLKDCQFDFQYETELLEFAKKSCTDQGLHVVGESSYQFSPQGFTFTVLLAESHLCMHTWPEHKSVAFDIYTCNHSENNNNKTREVYYTILKELNPQTIDERFINRSNLKSF